MKYLMSIMLVIVMFQAQAAQLDSIDAAKSLAKNVMTLVSEGKSPKGLELFKPYLIIPEAEFDVMLNSLRMQQPMIDQRFGNTIGIELVGEEVVGKSFLKITYAQKFERHVMRWVFFFYKPKTGWVLNTFKTDDKIQLLFP